MYRLTSVNRQGAGGKKHLAPWLISKGGSFFPVGKRYVDNTIKDVAQSRYTQMQQTTRYDRPAFHEGTVRQPEVPIHSLNVRPTHFFSLRVPKNSHFMTQMATIHMDIADFHADLAKFLIPQQKLHVTTSVASIREQDVPIVVEIATSVVRDTKPGPLRLFSRGMGHFSDSRVLFAKIAPEKDFTKLDRLGVDLRLALTEGIQAKGIRVNLKGNPNDSYVPHVTVAKLRHDSTIIQGASKEVVPIRSFPRSLWSHYQYEDMGEFVSPTLDLCEMKTDNATGYYKVVASIPL